MIIRQGIPYIVGGLLIIVTGTITIQQRSTDPVSEPQVNSIESTSTVALETPAIVTSTPSAASSTKQATSSSEKETPKNTVVQQAPSTTPETTVATGSNRAPINVPLGDQSKLSNTAVAIVCVSPMRHRDDSSFSSGTGIIMNTSGYVLTNAHVIGTATNCYVGRKRAIPPDYQTRAALPTIALYYSLDLIGKGSYKEAIITEENLSKSSNDFAILKIGKKLPQEFYRSNDAPSELKTLNNTYIPWATEEEYAAFPKNGVFPAISLNMNYEPVISDVLSIGGFIGSNTNPDYVFAAGRVIKINTTSFITEMPTGQGLSGSAIVDNEGRMVGLNHATDCTLSGGCTAYGDDETIHFLYGKNSIAITLPALDKAMKADLGFGLKELQAKQ